MFHFVVQSLQQVNCLCFFSQTLTFHSSLSLQSSSSSSRTCSLPGRTACSSRMLLVLGQRLGFFYTLTTPFHQAGIPTTINQSADSPWMSVNMFPSLPLLFSSRFGLRSFHFLPLVWTSVSAFSAEIFKISFKRSFQIHCKKNAEENILTVVLNMDEQDSMYLWVMYRGV